MQRNVTPELLDALPPDDVHAMRSRRDLARINRVMRQQALMAKQLRRLPRPKTLVDLGSGDGRFLLGVARRLDWWGVRAVIADRQDIVSEKTRAGFHRLGWKCEVLQGDIFQTLDSTPPGAIITANLFLHHFQDGDLKRLLHLAAARADAFIACEPRRSAFALFASKLVGLIGANAVTRHDAVASVRAGFTCEELTALWPPTSANAKGWACAEERQYLFTHCFVARPSPVRAQHAGGGDPVAGPRPSEGRGGNKDV